MTYGIKQTVRKTNDNTIRQTIELIPEGERENMTRIVAYARSGQLSHLQDQIMIYAIRHAKRAQRAALNLPRDLETRLTVSARVKVEDAERYRAAAHSTGRSLYRFVIDALETEAALVGFPAWKAVSGSEPGTQYMVPFCDTSATSGRQPLRN